MSFGAIAEEKAAEIKVSLSTKGNDVAFDTESLQVPFGRTVKLLFQNEADKDSAILHNIAILKPGSTDKVLKAFEDGGYEVDKIKDHKSVLAITPTLDPGEKSQLTLDKKVLSKPGFYPYVCLMPGHADMLGMKGILHVK